ncbi:hypothetical protein M409DRAFT_50852 [Zasmidium cellare ATCC 36951]|uniref:Beta-lactamase-related domain-containing protein n=1 Tax=Zasmidium cellare ATCC 36951 TaxID=1080233 RepID=A0A6A6D181_ZASCE|nr:uncharacterized protein M409DRAFT_50852 [Zasmidium cellare ATCC 36951]KAF2171406.1 hypothetical protein M409DRAFT_50852 [Zasmidium cellare ATCC 36951]
MRARENFTRKLETALDGIAELNTLYGAPSTSIGVLHHGRVLLSRSIGNRDGDPGHPADDSSVYLIGSLSKALVAAAVGILVDEGKLSWFDKVSEHLPGFDPIGDPSIAREADFIDLLRHSSGLGNPVVRVIGPFGTIVSSEEKFMDLVNATQTTNEHGNQRFNREFEYSNINYAIVALVIERITSLRFADFVQKRLLDPLGMKQTLVTKRGVNSVHDMLIWSAAWLSAQSEERMSSACLDVLKGVAKNPLRQVDRIFKPAWQLSIEQRTNKPSTYCLGWLRSTMPTSDVNWGSLNKRTMEDDTYLDYILGTESRERVMTKHTGIAYNTTSTMFLFPETNSAVIAMANGRRRGDASDFAAQIMIQELFDLQPYVDILARAKIETERGAVYRHNIVMAEWLKNRDVTGLERLKDYVGVYTTQGTELHVNLDRKINRLVLHFNNRSDKPVHLEYYNKDTYCFFPTTIDEHFSKGFFDFDNYLVGLLQFTRDDARSVSGLFWTWEIESKPIWYKREDILRARSPETSPNISPKVGAGRTAPLMPNNVIVAKGIMANNPKSGLLWSEVLKMSSTSAMRRVRA